jgi:predicted AAA+ superfamily ATPase
MYAKLRLRLQDKRKTLMVNRTLERTLQAEIKKNRKSILLLGARQVGKSTLLAKFNPGLSINLADEGQYREHLRDPTYLRRLVEGVKTNLPILLDEVQRLPSMLNTVQALIDGDPKRLFLISGSSARKLRHGNANLLPGRVFHHTLFPLTYWELAEDFDLDKALQIGTLPEIYLKDYGTDLLRNYIDTYLREEIQAEALVRNLEAFSRFIDLSATCSGSIINYSQLACDSEIPKENLRRFYDILYDTLILHRIPGYTQTKGYRKAIQREKMIFFDLGVRNGILRIEKNRFTETEKGGLFEQWVILQLIAYSRYHNKDWQFYFYRDDKKTEIDLIIDIGPQLWAIEIKYGQKLKPKYFEALSVFERIAKKPVRSLLLFRGKHREKWNGFEAIPYQDFFNELAP